MAMNADDRQRDLREARELRDAARRVREDLEGHRSVARQAQAEDATRRERTRSLLRWAEAQLDRLRSLRRGAP